ncbi:NTP transferase domain-containing protein [Aquiflexum sp. LQ15W]|uniref:mannose-1-phosphate guanylyltransferase n=1 Tax=Cognataquiflexum nitidum TaxID=2922272 RepID=UPI001F139E45|nr:sugar phosphate nucleotidyltransferase [Cognataquiflexum nitidum]MCH6201363.1 NTP transferase domain-containing protein [Cognataquiflexum nitidum]
MSIVNIILSGGIGSRLWPLSRKARPKQYLPIFGNQTLFQKTVLRNKDFCDATLVVGNQDNVELSRQDLHAGGIVNFGEIIEACPRNTAAAIAFAAFQVSREDIMFITPSDQLIDSGHAYASSVHRAIQLAKEGYIVTFGLRPTKPETGYGYIESNGEEVIAFCEKPDLHTAQIFLEKGNYLWNSGMFCFQAGVYLDELMEFEPELFHSAKRAIECADDGKLNLELSLQIPSVSVDYAVMEKTKKIKVVPSAFQWSDMGSFESIYEYFESQGYPKDSFGNMVIGTDIHTEFTGLYNTLLIQTKDAILVLRKEKAQEVKKLYERLEKERPELV